MTWREEAGSHGTAQRTRNRAMAARSEAAYRARRRAERGLVAHNRLKDPDVRRLVDPRTDTILCRLSPDFAGKLTALQVEAGKLVAQIYGEYHRATGQFRRSEASPYYERAFAGQGELGSNGHCAQAEKRYVHLQDIFDTLPTCVRTVLEMLCVDNLPIAEAYLPDVQVILDRIAGAFKLAETARQKNSSQRRLFDARIETVLCRLSPDFLGKLTTLQVEAGKLVAQIYGEFHRATGQRPRSCASPDYERAFVGSSELRPEIYRSDEYCARAEKRYTYLQKIFGTFASPTEVASARAAVERLCVDNLPIDATYLPGVAAMLNRVAATFDLFEST